MISWRFTDGHGNLKHEEWEISSLDDLIETVEGYTIEIFEWDPDSTDLLPPEKVLATTTMEELVQTFARTRTLAEGWSLPLERAVSGALVHLATNPQAVGSPGLPKDVETLLTVLKRNGYTITETE